MIQFRNKSLACLFTGLISSILPLISAASTTASDQKQLAFRVYLDDKEIGYHNVQLRRTPKGAEVSVGIADSGVEWRHEDLVENIYQNLGEDADGDGKVIEESGDSWVFDPGDIIERHLNFIFVLKTVFTATERH